VWSHRAPLDSVDGLRVREEHVHLTSRTVRSGELATVPQLERGVRRARHHLCCPPCELSLGGTCFQQRKWSSRATPPHRPREDGIAHPADTSITNRAASSQLRCEFSCEFSAKVG
jgi:hypothetical protein